MKRNLHLLESVAVAAGLGACINTAVYAAEENSETSEIVLEQAPDVICKSTADLDYSGTDLTDDLTNNSEQSNVAAKEVDNLDDSKEGQNTLNSLEPIEDHILSDEEDSGDSKEAINKTNTAGSEEAETQETIAQGWKDGQYYENGALAVGAQTIDGKEYLFDESGTLLTGLQNGKYYDPETGTLAENTQAIIDGDIYTIDAAGNAALQMKQVTQTIMRSSQAVTLQGYVVSGSTLPDLSKINADFIVIQSTGGSGYINSGLSKMADAILKGGYLLGMYHEAGQGGYKTTAEMEAYAYFAATRNYIGKFMPILKYTTMTSNTGPAWVKDFLDAYYGLTGVRCELQTTAANRTNGDWREVDKEYRTTENLTVYAGTANDWKAAMTPVKTVNVKELYRMYNPNSGEHFYTAEAGERDHLVQMGWRYESIGWTAPNTGQQVYRLYNPNAGDHHYTLNWNEKEMLVKAGWRYEGICWSTDAGRKTAVYRSYNPNAVAGAHHFTTSLSEHQFLLKNGWRDEGIAWYGTV